MSCGLFGKLPSKRDFISYNVPRPFLTFWENWLQSAVAASRSQLGAAWQDVFLTAPIWRFWIGDSLCGAAVAGAIMPSVDKIGRYFPLSLIACAPDGMRIEPPPVDPMDSWYKAAEEALLRALDESFEGEPAALVEKLDFPRLEPSPVEADTSQVPVWTLPDETIGNKFKSLLAKDHLEIYGKRTYWWTRGGTNRLGQIAMCTGMPDPYFFSGLLTGRFAGTPGP